MRKLLLLTGACLSFSACTTTVQEPIVEAPGNLTIINDKINTYKYIFEAVDNWSTPAEFYANGGGDCEDFSIAKMALVKKQNPNAKLKIHIVFDVDKSIGHAVLVVDDEWVLDNQKDYVYSIKSWDYRGRYVPIYETSSPLKPE